MEQENVDIQSAPSEPPLQDHVKEPCQEVKDYVARMTATWPDFTPEQCRKIANILNW